MTTTTKSDHEQTEIALLAAMILVKRRKTNCYPIPDCLVEMVDQLIALANSDSKPVVSRPAGWR